MSGNLPLFDHLLLAARRQRALKDRARFSKAGFLRAAAIEEMAIRLGAVRRHFDTALDLDAPDGAMAQALRSSGKARVCKLGAGFCKAAIDTPLDEAGHPVYPATGAAQPYALITSVLSLHFANDLPGTLSQIRKGLKPDGLFFGALLGGDTLIELRSSLLEAESQITGGAVPRVAPFIQLRNMGTLLQQAGFALPVVDQDIFKITYADPMRLLYDLRAMGAGNVLSLGARQPLRPSVLKKAMAIYKARYAAGNGKTSATFQILFLSGWAPHESQQKPLKPGSAQMRLADALKEAGPKPANP